MGAVAAAVAAVLIVAIIATVIVILHRRASRLAAQLRGLPGKGDLDARQERLVLAQNSIAADLFRELLANNTPTLGDVADITVLGESHRSMIRGWLNDNATIQKGLPQR